MWLLNALVIALALAVYFGVVDDLGAVERPFDIPWWWLAALFCAAEIYAVHIEFRRNAHSYALGEIPLVLGLFFVSPEGLVAAQLVGAFVVLGLYRRQSPLKLVFNVGRFCLEASLAAVIFNSIVKLGDPSGVWGWGAAFAATFVITVLGVAAIFGAISLSEGRARLRDLRGAIALAMIVAGANTSLALIAVTILWSRPEAVWLLLLPTATLFAAYRAYTAERQKHSSLEFLYETARVLQSSQHVEPAMVELLSRTRAMFRAGMAEITLFSRGENDVSLRTTSGPDESIDVMRPVDVDVTEGIWSEVAEHGRSLLLARRPLRDARFIAYCEERGIRDAMVAPLRGETRVFGCILIGNRLGDVSPFDKEDLKLFETLAHQASVSLERGRLEQSLVHLTKLEKRLKHQAFHDSLTTLANRALFTDRVEHALAKRERAARGLAVLFLDLDDFKTVNDSLGHEAGDKLLVTVADRLKECLRPGDTAARLGGDEFAVLLEDMDHPDDATYVADRIIEALGSPLSLQGKEQRVRASIGIAVDSGGADGASELLRNADLAMYKAKGQGKGRHEVFRPSMHADALLRLELKEELQQAVDRGEFVIHFQPWVVLESGEIAGIEALVRWQHPTRGLIEPGEFIGLAEETGLILAIGRWVMEEACRKAKLWQLRYPSGVPLRMSINLSARQLQQEDLVEQVAQVLRACELSPESLILEITESALMQDAEATIERLRLLKRLGVLLAIDDFGTGYSSLSYLKQFPVDILKIAKYFVDGVVDTTEESALARAIVKLGGTLRLETVAEGIEQVEQRDQLHALQCGMGQGYYFARPLEGDAMEALLASGDREPGLRPHESGDGGRPSLQVVPVLP